MFSVGLYLWDTPRPKHGVNPRLLMLRFSVQHFLQMVAAALAPAPPLFPALHAASVVPLTNTRRGAAKVCAADDLELSLIGGVDQIEFFEGYAPAGAREPQGLDRYYLGSDAYSVSVDEADAGASMRSLFEGLDDFSSLWLLAHLAYPPAPVQRPVPFYDGAKLQLPFVHIQSQALPLAHAAPGHQLHFAMNAFGLPAHPFFTDFRQARGDAGSVYGSSADLFDSPLDEMFFKKPLAVPDTLRYPEHARKRKHKPSTPLSSDSAYADVPLSDAELPCNLKFEPAKKFKPDSFHELVPERKPEYPLPDVGEYPLEVDDDKKLYACKQCDAVFRVKLYLTRHLRKHYNAKAFVCPFYQDADETDTSGRPGTKCHSTGGFSRRDTFKTHLKALHFIYPPGTKSSARGSIGGRCAGCFEYFDNNTLWLKTHIEGGACKGAVLATAHVKEELDE